MYSPWLRNICTNRRRAFWYARPEAMGSRPLIPSQQVSFRGNRTTLTFHASIETASGSPLGPWKISPRPSVQTLSVPEWLTPRSRTGPSPATRWLPSTRSLRAAGVGAFAGVATGTTGLSVESAGGFDGTAAGPAAWLAWQLASATASKDDEPSARRAPTIPDDTAVRWHALACHDQRSLAASASLYWGAPRGFRGELIESSAS